VTDSPPLVTIVIPTHDRPVFLAEAVASARVAADNARALGTVEVLVVDNSSTAELTAQARQIADAHGARFTQSGNGPSVARNAGVAASTSEYIAFLDDDDALLPEHLTTLLPVFDAHPTCALAFGQLILCNERLEPVIDTPQPAGPFPAGEGFAFSIGTIVQPNTLLVRRSVFVELGGFDEQSQRNEDWDLLMRLAAQHDIFGVEIAVSLTRQHDGLRSTNRLSYAGWRDMIRESRIVEKRGLSLPARVPLTWRERKFGRFRLRGQSAYLALCHAQDSLRDGHIADARGFVWGAFRRSPVHAVKLAPRFRRDLVAITRGRAPSAHSH
jgi:glycosyltransferase involved in cell wall biosynthesis